MAIVDPEFQVKSRWRWYLLGAGLTVVALIVYLVFGTQPTRTNKRNSIQLTGSPLESARQTLSRETDIDSCRSALNQINAYLAKKETRQPAPLTSEEESSLRARCGLDAGELAEISGSTYSSLDSHHLELCFLLRDAAASLDVEHADNADGQRRLPSLRQAAAAFAWTVREVRQEQSDAPTLPPLPVLRRGWGTPLERALVFLELLRHVGTADERFTGCLVFCPDKDGDQRLWACGVLINDKPDLYLFDPRLGLPIPGLQGKGIATLADACTNKDVLAQLSGANAPHYDVTTEQAAKAELRYVCSLSALAQRMRTLEAELLPPAVKVRLFVDVVAETKRLDAAKVQPGKHVVVKPWLDHGASGAGVLRRFLPPEEGGVDETKPIGRRELFRWEIVPWRAMPDFFRDESRFPPRVGLGQRIRAAFAGPFLQAALEPHHARDELLRGHFQKAVPELVETRTLCQDAQNRLSQEKNILPEMNEWIEKAFALYADQQRAAGNPQQLAEINSKIEALWREARVVSVVLEGTRAYPQRREAVFQLGLCKHEQAARLQLQSELKPDDTALAQRTVDAWKEAVNVWQQYLDEYSGNPLAGNAAGAAVRALGRARLLSGDRAAALRTWRLDVPTAELEKVGTLFLAKKNER